MKYASIILLSFILIQYTYSADIFSLTQDQETVLKEYRLEQLEKCKEQGKKFREVCIKTFPEYSAKILAYEILLKSLAGEEIFIFEEVYAFKDLIFASIQKHSELQEAIQPYYDDAKCQECFLAGFNTVFEEEEFKMFYALGFAALAKDKTVEEMAQKIGLHERAVFADELISKKLSKKGL